MILGIVAVVLVILVVATWLGSRRQHVEGLALAGGVTLRDRQREVWRYVGHAIGWMAVVIGLSGVILHLDSQFFYERTIRSLTYAAPFVAPLAYTGLGFLLIANRMIDAASVEWAQWILLLALGGFIGNFVFSLTDHATNGFFNPLEWVPVASSAFAISFLLMPFVTSVGVPYLKLSAAVLLLQAAVGVIGFALHAAAVLRQPGATLLERILGGAPPIAPLLFPNLVILGLIALWVLSHHVQQHERVVQRAARDGDEQRPDAYGEHRRRLE